ncbi:pilin [Luteibacter sp.]|uniref:pilin n=1 Tax=Luteibacter sp. TaxID=1886636 RepID=UPI003F7EBA61
MDEKIWIGRGGQKYGPYEEAALRRWVHEGKVTLDVLAWRRGMVEWVKLSSLLPDVEAPPPMPPSPAGWDVGPAPSPARAYSPASQARAEPEPEPEPDFNPFSHRPAVSSFSARDDGGFAPDVRRGFPMPPALHWFGVLVLAFITGGVFAWAWAFVQASWVKKIDKDSKSMLLLGLSAVSYVGGFAVAFYEKPPFGPLVMLLLFLVSIVLFYIAIYSMAAAVEHDARRRGLFVRLGGITLFFFHIYYLQGTLTWLGRWKGAGLTEPAPPNGVMWCILLIPLPVVSILAAIAIPQYQNYIIRSQVMAGEIAASPVRQAVTAYYGNHGQLPHDNLQAGLMDATALQAKYVTAISVEDGRISVTLGGEANIKVAGGVLTLTPAVAQGALQFTCSTDTIPAQYLPKDCR